MEYDNNVFIKLDLGKKESSSYRDERKRRVMNMLEDWEFVNSKLSTHNFNSDPDKLNLLLEELADQYYQIKLQGNLIKEKKKLTYSKAVNLFKKDNVIHDFIDNKKEISVSAIESSASKFSRNISNKSSQNTYCFNKSSNSYFKFANKGKTDKEYHYRKKDKRNENKSDKITYFDEVFIIKSTFAEKKMPIVKEKINIFKVIDNIIPNQHVKDYINLKKNPRIRNSDPKLLQSEDIPKEKEKSKSVKKNEEGKLNELKVETELPNNKTWKKIKEDPMEEKKKEIIIEIIKKYHENINCLSRSNGFLIERSLKDQRDCKTSYFRPNSNSPSKSIKKSFSGVNFFDDPNYRGNRINNFSFEKKNPQEIENLIVKSCNKEIKKSERNIINYYRKSHEYIERIGYSVKKGIEGRQEMKFMRNFRKELLKDKEKLNLLFSKNDRKLFVSKDKNKLSQEIISLKKILKK